MTGNIHDNGVIFDCAKTINVALFGYSAIGYETPQGQQDDGENILKTIAPDLPTHLQTPHGVAALSPQSKSRYAIRMLRESSYVYFFAKRTKWSSDSDWVLDGIMVTGHQNVSASTIQNITANQKSRLELMISVNDSVNANKMTPSTTIQTDVDVVEIWDPCDIEEMRVLYTAVELQESTLQRIVKTPKLIENFQNFNIAAISKAPQDTYIDVIAKDRLSTTVAEFLAGEEVLPNMPNNPTAEEFMGAARSNNPAFQILQDQFFPYPESSDEPRKRRIEGIGQALEEKIFYPGARRAQGVALVLLDPVAITQELNNWRNTTWAQFKADYLEKKSTTSPYGASNEYEIQVANMVRDLKENYPKYAKYEQVGPYWKTYKAHKRKLIHSLEQFEQGKDLITDPMLNSLWRNDISYTAGEIDSVSKLPHDAKAALDGLEKAWPEFDQAMHAAFPNMQDRRNEPAAGAQSSGTAASAHAPTTAAAPFEQFLNTSLMEAAQTRYNTAQKEHEGKAALRAAAHIKWLRSAELRNALAHYDPKNELDGVVFSHLVGLCIQGAVGTAEGYKAIIGNWLTEYDGMSETRVSENLIMRALCFNQSQLLTSLNDLLTNANEDKNLAVMAEPFIKASADAFGLFANVYNLLDSMAGSHAGVAALHHAMQMGILKTAGPNFVDKRIYRVLNSMMLSSITNSYVEDVREHFVQNRMLSNAERARQSGAKFARVWEGILRPFVEEQERVDITKRTPNAAIQAQQKISRELENSWQHLESAQGGSDFAKMRLASVNVTMQGIVLVFQLNVLLEKGDTVDLLNVLGTIAMTASAATDVVSTYLEASHNAMLKAGSYHAQASVQGHMRLLARWQFVGFATSCAGGSLFLAADIIKDGEKLFGDLRSKNPALWSAYLIKFMGNSLLLLGAFDQLSGKAISNFMRVLANRAGGETAKMATRIGLVRGTAFIMKRGLMMAAASLQGGVSAVISAVVLVVSVVLAVIESNDTTSIDDWCKDSVFRNAKYSGIFDGAYGDMDKEMGKMSVAVQNLVYHMPLTMSDIEYFNEKEWFEGSLSRFKEQVAHGLQIVGPRQADNEYRRYD